MTDDQRTPAPADTSPAAEAPAPFRTRMEVLRYLQAEGWDIQKSALYNHHAQGKIPSEPDGSFARAAVERYARNYLRRVGQGSNATDEALARRKQEASIKADEARAEMLRLKMERDAGASVPREWAEQQIATRARLLRADMLNWVRMYIAELVELVDGKPSLIPDALVWSEKHVETWLDNYARAGEIRLQERPR